MSGCRQLKIIQQEHFHVGDSYICMPIIIMKRLRDDFLSSLLSGLLLRVCQEKAHGKPGHAHKINQSSLLFFVLKINL